MKLGWKRRAVSTTSTSSWKIRRWNARHFCGGPRKAKAKEAGRCWSTTCVTRPSSTSARTAARSTMAGARTSVSIWEKYIKLLYIHSKLCWNEFIYILNFPLKQFRTLNVWKRPCLKNGNYSKCIERCFVAAAADRMTCRLPFMDEIAGKWILILLKICKFKYILFLIFQMKLLFWLEI